MSDVATDSVAPAEGQATPAAKTGTVHEAASRFAALMGVAPEAPESPEVAPQEASGEEEEEAEGQQDAKEESAAPKYKVKVDGEEIEVGLDEALQGYQRTADYTRKTQALAEQRKALEAEQERVRAERSQYDQALEWAKKQLESQQKEPDWARLESEDPIEFLKQKELWRERKEQLQAVEAERAKVAEQQRAEFAAAMQKKLHEENEKLLGVFQDWRKAEKRTEAQAKLLEYGKKLGFSEAELAQVYDHRAIVMLEKARAYDELMAKGQQKLKEAPAKSPAAAKPGTVSSRQVNRELADAKARLKQSGKVGDAADALKRLFASNQ